MDVENVTYVRLDQAEMIQLLKQAAVSLIPTNLLPAKFIESDITVTLTGVGCTFTYSKDKK